MSLRCNDKEIGIFAMSAAHPVDHSGFLQKKGEYGSALRQRWFVLKGNMLFYYKSKTDRDPIGFIFLEGCAFRSIEDATGPWCFTIEWDGLATRTYLLYACDADDRKRWLAVLGKSSMQHLRQGLARLQQQNLQLLQQFQQHLGTGTTSPFAQPTASQPQHFNQAPTTPDATRSRQGSVAVDPIFDDARIAKAAAQPPARPPPPTSPAVASAVSAALVASDSSANKRSSGEISLTGFVPKKSGFSDLHAQLSSSSTSLSGKSTRPASNEPLSEESTSSEPEQPVPLSPTSISPSAPTSAAASAEFVMKHDATPVVDSLRRQASAGSSTPPASAATVKATQRQTFSVGPAGVIPGLPNGGFSRTDSTPSTAPALATAASVPTSQPLAAGIELNLSCLGLNVQDKQRNSFVQIVVVLRADSGPVERCRTELVSSNLASPQFQAMAVFSGSELEEFADIVVQFDLVQVEGKTGVLLGMTSISFAQLTRAVDGVFDLILTHPGTRDVRGTLRIVSTIPTRHVQKNELTRRPEQSKRPPSAPTSAPTLGKKDVFATAQQQYAEMALALVSPPQSISQQYHFEFSFKKAEGGTDTRKLDVLEEMFESHFTYSVPVQYLRLLIDEHQRRVHDLEGIGRLPFEAWETARLTQLEQRAALLNFCREQLTLLETFHGPRFKSSRLKREPQLQFVPTNCHIQRMSVVDDRKLQRRYETVTFGAPSAQAIGFKRGGLKRLLQQRDDAAVVAGSGAPSATATTAPALSGGLAGVANGLLPPPLPVGDSTPTAFLATAKQLLNNVDMIERDIDSLRAKLTHAGYTPATLEQRARLLQAALAPLTERVFHLISMLEAPGVEYCHQAARLLDERAATQTHQRNASNPDALVETGGHNNPRSTTAGALDSGADARSRSVSVLNSGASVAVSTAHATSASPDSTSAAHPRTVSVSSASQRASDHILAALDQSAAASNAHPAGKQSPGPGVDWVSVEHHFTRETAPAMPAIFSSVLDDGTETKLQEQLRAVNHACKDLMMGDSSVDTSLLDRTSDELCELMSNVSKGVRACLLVVMSQIESRMLNFMELVQRRDVVFSQALASAVTGFVSILSTHGANPVFLEQLEQLGLLMQFESLLSTSGNEMGMLEDMVVGVQDLAHISFVLHSPTSPAALLHQQGIGAVGQPQPASVALPVPTAVEDEAWTVWLSGERREVTVHVRVSESVFSRLPQTLQEGRPVRLEPILFSQGVNEAQTLANTVGDASLQHGINDDNFRSLENYLQRYIAFRVGQHARSTSASATADVSTLATLDHDVNEELKLIDSIRVQLAGAMQLSKGKNIEILVLSERLVRRLNGVRLTSCKSAKDRTSMSVTLEQYTLLHDDYGLIPSSQQQVLDVMRGRGTRIKNAEKNIGEQRYAFNRIQLLTLPKLYRPPDNTAGAAMS